VTDLTAPPSPSGEQLELRSGGQCLVVVSGGGGIRRYSLDGRDLLDGYARHEVCAGARGQLLSPWPNRVRDGRYEFGGDVRQLALTEPAAGNAIHGLSRWHSWTVEERDGQRVVLGLQLIPQMGYPHLLQLRAEYTLDDDGVGVTLTATNRGAAPAPYGIGAHPYLRASAGLIDSCTLQIPAATRLVSDDRHIPVERSPVAGTEFDYREPRLIGSTRLDSAFCDLARDPDGIARVVFAAPDEGLALTLWMDRAHEYVMAFTGDTLADRPRQGLAIEPMSCPPNALASGDHLIVLHPGESHAASWGITPTRA
jgi:aldose 1-epimerase